MLRVMKCHSQGGSQEWYHNKVCYPDSVCEPLNLIPRFLMQALKPDMVGCLVPGVQKGRLNSENDV